jgi:hypothetical protein
MSFPPQPPPPPGQNPYASPSFAAPVTTFATVVGQSQMEYMRSYQYIFENPDWLKSVLFLGLLYIGAIIPGVNMLIQVVYLGYQFEIIEFLLKSQGRQYPNFDFGRFGDYLGRGIWPFLANMVASFVIIPIFYVGLIVGFLAVGGIVSAAGEEMGPPIGIAFGAVLLLLMIAGMFALSFVMAAMILRSGLVQDFASAFQFDWVSDFCKKMWLEMLLSGLFLSATATLLLLLGLAAACIGVLFTLPLVIMASAHILYQLYVVYLSRGGMPVPIKMTAQPVMGPPL